MSVIPNPFLITMIAFLEPYFICAGIDIATARAEIVETLGSYGTRSRSEILNAAQIIAFSMSTLETLREAKADEMSPSMRVRYRGCANGLNRSSQQHEKTLALRLACDLPTAVDPVNDVSDAAAQEAAQQAQAKIDSYRNRLWGRAPHDTGVHAEPVPQGPAPRIPASKMRGAPMPEFQWPAVKVSPEEEARNNEMWGDAMIKMLGEMGRPVQPIAARAQDGYAEMLTSQPAGMLQL